MTSASNKFIFRSDSGHQILLNKKHVRLSNGLRLASGLSSFIDTRLWLTACLDVLVLTPVVFLL